LLFDFPSTKTHHNNHNTSFFQQSLKKKKKELTENSVLGLGLNGEVKSVLVVGGSTEWVNAGAWGWV
jgi:hypothetical protein